MNTIKTITVLGLMLIATVLKAQPTQHLIYFTDKDNTPFSIQTPDAFLSQKAIDRRSRQGISIKRRDLPVDPVYVDSLRSIGAEVWYTSRWFNAAFILADPATLSQIQNLGFVQNSQPLERGTDNTQKDWKVSTSIPQNKGIQSYYGESAIQVEMLNADIMHNLGYTGEGITIAVHDNGFQNANVVTAFQSLRDRGGILGAYDFVQNDSNVYDNGSHGTMVLSTMAAYLENQIIGLAFGADYYLFVTENTGGENPDEEVYWLIAAERADSLGVDIINTSLGYNTFENSALNYTYNDLDGRTTIISKASEIAANTGMLIVTSAGNAGNGSWHYITAPGDADSIMTAGAVDSSLAKAGFSSFGPTADGRIKPDLSALGVDAAVVDPFGSVLLANGTSFSSPILAGLAAGFWQAHPDLTAQEVIEYLKLSATQSLNPDTLLGWGIPDFALAHKAITGVEEELSSSFQAFPNPSDGAEITLTWKEHELNASVSVSVFNAMGSMVASIGNLPNTGRAHVPFSSGLTPGLYMVVIEGQTGRMSTPLIVR